MKRFRKITNARLPKVNQWQKIILNETAIKCCDMNISVKKKIHENKCQENKIKKYIKE